MAKIVSLRSENVKRISVVEITPDGSLVVIGGKNAQGKSSVLDSIFYALGGGSSLPEVPLRAGERKGSIRLDLGGMVVERKFSAKGASTVVVTMGDGAEMKSPQAILDQLCGKIAFDPLEFTRRKPKEQMVLLQQLLGVDLDAFNAERQAAYDRRTQVNRSIKNMEGELAALPVHPGLPGEPVDASKIADEMQAAVASNAAIERRRRELTGLFNRVESFRVDAAAAERELSKAQDGLAAAEREYAAAQADDLQAPALIDLSGFRDRIASADEINRKIRESERRAEVLAAIKKAEDDAENLKDQIERVDGQKADAIAKAEFPIPGLGFSDEGILYNGLPFDQASSAQQIKVSAAIGIALNPKLRVLLMREGSLLDADSLAAVAELAEAHDAQIWIERVGDGAECSVVIEDGAVKEVRPAKVKAAVAADGGAS